jgi:PAS domain S-box-containing protein
VPSSPGHDARLPRAIAAAAIGAIALIVGVVWHVVGVRAAARAAAERSLTGRAMAAARLVDTWFAQRGDDADELVTVAQINGGDSLAVRDGTAERLLVHAVQSLRRREGYPAVWMFDAARQPLVARGGAALSPAEDSALTQALQSRQTVVSWPERRDSIITATFVRPVTAIRRGTPAIVGAVVLRANLDHAFAQSTSAAPRPAATISPVIVVPAPRRLLGLTRCATSAPDICLIAASDTLGRLSQDTTASWQRIALLDGRHVFVATRRLAALPWSVYVAQDQSAVYAQSRRQFESEALLLLVMLAVGGLAIYAYDRSANLRQLTERAQTEARFASIVNTAMDAIVIVDEAFDIVMLNLAAVSMFGYPSHEASGRSVLDLIPDGMKDELRRALAQTLAGGTRPRRFTAERYAAGRRRDGSVFPMDLSVSRSQMDGRPTLTIVMRDITDWKRAEDNSEWQRRVLEAIATGVELREVLRTVARFHETQCPGVECSIHLVDDDGMTLRTTCAPSMRPEFVEGMDEIVVGPHSATCGTAVYRREQVVTPDITTDRLWNDYRALALEQGYHACWATPIRSPQGRVLGALAMYVRDARQPTAVELRVSAVATQLAGIAVDRAHAAESLRQSEASFRSFVENSPIGIYRATGTGRLLAVNASLVQLLGYNSALELLQVDMTKELFVSADDRDRLLNDLQAHGELRSTEMEWRRKDHRAVTVRVSARAYRDERGAVWFSEGFVENVTPLRVAEQALRQSEKLAALGQLVSGVAHELNNPLAAILHFAEDLLDDERTPDDLDALKAIRDQARRSRSIVRDLLAFVRFRDAARDRVSVVDALNAAVKGVQPAIAESGATLTVQLPPADATGSVDRAGIQQIITNLVVNAAQASGRGGRVRLDVSVNAPTNALRIVVEDSGPGIPDTLMDRIFEPFFTTKPIGQGTGLGLSVTLGIVQQLGGAISVENRSGDGEHGARFTVELPLQAGSAEPEPSVADSSIAVRAVPGDGSKQPHVLIIDDEASIRAALRRFFARRGWAVSDAEDGTTGLGMILSRGSDYDVIISDLKMPGCSGVELHDHVAAVAPDLLDRIIFSTGDVASRDAADFVRRTRCIVMQKPFELRSLEGVVARLRQGATA